MIYQSSNTLPNVSDKTVTETANRENLAVFKWYCHSCHSLNWISGYLNEENKVQCKCKKCNSSVSLSFE